MTRTFSRRLLSCALISGTVLLTPAWAQTATAQVGKPLGRVSTKSAKSTHRVRDTTAAASAVEAESSLNADDARYLLDRTGFQADESQVRSWVGLSREQAVDRLLAGALLRRRRQCEGEAETEGDQSFAVHNTKYGPH